MPPHGAAGEIKSTAVMLLQEHMPIKQNPKGCLDRFGNP